MTQKIDLPNSLRTVELAKVISALAPAETRLVGGVVRDLLANTLKPEAALDVDLATTATPEEVLQSLQAAEIKAVPTGIDHGTITAVLNGKSFEITSLREDVSTDGRRATVSFTTDFEVDSQRRDFTINAMYLAPDGTLYDFHNGAEDLKAGVVRFIGDADTRIREDYLRIIRYCRFYAGFGQVEPDSATQTLLKTHIDELTDLSAERITSEFLKLFSGPNPVRGWELMQQIGALDKLGFVDPTHYSIPAITRHSELFADEVNPIERFVCLYGLYAPLVAQDSLLMFSTRQQKLIDTIADGLNHFTSSQTNEDLLYEVGEDAAGAVLRIMICEAAVREDDNEEIALLGRLDSLKNTEAPEFPLKGQDVIDLGIPAGPLVGEILGQIEDWWQEAGYPPREDCYEQLQTLLGKAA